MKLIRPVSITDSNLTSTNVTEDDYSAWSSSTSYVVGNKVIVVATHKIYEALTNNNNKYPPSYLEGSTPDWIEIGSTNAWNMFDQSYQSQTSNIESIEIVCEPGRINSLGLMNVEATSITVKMESDETVVYEKTIDMIINNVNDLYEYYFNPIERKTDFVITDLPIYSDNILTITISGGITDTVKCGLCIPGFYIHIGDSLWGCSMSILDYSKKEADIFGNISILERPYSSVLSDSILVQPERTGYIKKLLASFRTTPALWVASEDYEGTFIYGFYRDFSIVLEDYNMAQCSIEIEGLT